MTTQELLSRARRLARDPASTNSELRGSIKGLLNYIDAANALEQAPAGRVMGYWLSNSDTHKVRIRGSADMPASDSFGNTYTFYPDAPTLQDTGVTEEMVDVAYAVELGECVPNIVTKGESWNHSERYYFGGVEYFHIDDAKRAQNKARIRKLLEAAALTPRPQPDEREVRNRVIEECAQIADKHRARIDGHNPDKMHHDELAQGYGNASLNIAVEIRRLTHPSNTPKTDTGGTR